MFLLALSKEPLNHRHNHGPISQFWPGYRATGRKQTMTAPDAQDHQRTSAAFRIRWVRSSCSHCSAAGTQALRQVKANSGTNTSRA